MWWLTHAPTHLICAWPQQMYSSAKKMPEPWSTDHNARWSSLIPALESFPLALPWPGVEKEVPHLSTCQGLKVAVEGSRTAWENLCARLAFLLYPLLSWGPGFFCRLSLLSSQPSRHLCFCFLCISTNWEEGVTLPEHKILESRPGFSSLVSFLHGSIAQLIFVFVFFFNCRIESVTSRILEIYLVQLISWGFRVSLVQVMWIGAPGVRKGRIQDRVVVSSTWQGS